MEKLYFSYLNITAMTHLPLQKHTFYGTTTLGEKGQVVIPSEARTALQLKKGEKLLVFGMGTSMLAMAKIESLEQFAASLRNKLDAVQAIMKKEGKR